MPDTSTPASLFFYALAFSFVGVGVKSVMEKKRYWVGLALGLSAIIFYIIGYYWTRLRDFLGPRLTGSVENITADFRFWLALIVLILVYVMVSSVVQTIRDNLMESIIKQDIPALNAAIKAYLLPRSLTPSQRTEIGRYLSRFPTHQLTIRVINDNEAGAFRADLQNAIEQGGWTIKTIENVSEAREGLTIQFDQTQASIQTRDDPRNPKEDAILQQALTQAGVPLDGTGGGSSSTMTENSLFLVIGRRRRDTIVERRY
jgi:hypothetical protein